MSKRGVKGSSARILQVATTGSTRSLTSDPLLSEWLLKLRDKPCLPDIRAALAYAFERSLDDIKAYLEENFALAPEAMVVTDQDRLAFEDNADPISPSMPKAEDVSGESVVSENDAVGGEDEEDMPEPPPPDDDDADNDDMRDPEDEPDVVSRPRPAPKPPRPNIMARFALAQGYRADGDDRFFHADGSWISRANATKFPWERRSSSGELQCHYYPKEHCLEREPLQIEAEIWGLVDQKPEVYSFILLDPEGAPVEMTGMRTIRTRRWRSPPRRSSAPPKRRSMTM